MTAESPSEELVITRVFDAPRELVFATWTQREHLMRWWGPSGFTMVSCTLDLRPGGRFHYCMRSPDGNLLWGKWTFHEIASPERLSFAVAFSDADGNTVPNPYAPAWPPELLSTLVFEEREGTTVLTMHGSPLGANDAQRAAFDASHDSMRHGFAGTFEQLETYLREIA